MERVLRTLAEGLADRYEVERELGTGGMATVYLARDVRHDRRVAVKVMRPEVSASVGTERFLREVRVAARLNHPHILALHDSGRVPVVPQGAGPGSSGNDLLYYVMPYVEGESLRDRLRREGPLTLADALRIASEVADALAFAHAQGIIHRDVKPENILLAGYPGIAPGSWHALVADFGIARLLADSGTELTATGVSVGTPAYMSPEQASGERIDARADIYSLGCVLYEMLVGEPPFTGPTASAVLARHLSAPVSSIRTVRPSVPADLESVVHRALEKVAADRIASAEAFRTAIDRLRARLGAGEVEPEPRAPRRDGRRFMPRALFRRGSWHRVAAVAAGLALAVLGGYLAVVRPRAGRGGPSEITAAATPRGALDRARIVVIPQQMLGDSAHAYLADAFTDELISALSRVGRLRVLARSSVQAIDRAGRSPADIGRAVAAASVVEGTFHQQGDSLRYDVRLIDVDSGDLLWDGHYARHVRDLSGVPDSVASAVVGRLGPGGLGGVAASTTSRVNGAAYDAYLHGLAVARRAANLQPPPRALEDSAVQFFERALELDPGFALAHASIASIYNTRYFTYDPSPRWEDRAFVEIEKALELDPGLAEAYQEKGNLTWTRANGFPHEAAAKLHRKATALKPSLVRPHESLGAIYMHVGLFDRALAEYDSALALDPTTTFVPPRIARIHWYQGKYEQALREFEAVPVGRMEAERALTLNYLGRPREALAVLEAAVRGRPPSTNGDFHAARAVVLASLGSRAAALDAIDHALRGGTESSHFHHAAYSIAQAYALLGDRDRALEYLRRTAAWGMPCYPLFRNDPHLRGLRGDPRFVQFMSELQRRFEDLAKVLE